jgi:hypothetical protein
MWCKATYYRSATFAAISALPVIVAYALLGATEARAATCNENLSECQPYVVTIDQVGPNVVATGSGEFDLTRLTHGGGDFGARAIFFLV